MCWWILSAIVNRSFAVGSYFAEDDSAKRSQWEVARNDALSALALGHVVGPISFSVAGYRAAPKRNSQFR